MGKGSSLEAIVLASQGNVIAVTKMMAGARFIGKGRFIHQKGVVDFVGTVCGSGRAICFDAKQCDVKGRYPVGNRDHLASHQVDYLIRQGRAGAVSGLIVEATHASLAAFFWCDWDVLVANEPSMKWDDPRLLRLGSNRRAINFAMVPGVVSVAA
jgi:penicillin-binding protein-related factor A (putative recombinase)